MHEGQNTALQARYQRFSCLEVEPAEDARPEVQATAIEVKGTAARRQESMVAKRARLLSGNHGKECVNGHSCPSRHDCGPSLLQISCGHNETDISVLLVVLTAVAWAQTSAPNAEVQTVYPEAHAFYLDLHQNPELSSHETQTAEKLASHLRDLGYTVTEHVGGTGVVAILKNGAGPTVMLRTELDALPVEEKTGLPYASKVRTKDDSGREVGVMHACGHDVHMASLFGTAAIMAHSKNTWHGTLILIGQPAEETIAGAKSMIEDGLMTRFPKPDVAVALHVGNELPAGQVGVGPGYRFSNADSLRITIYGKGGHGSMPNITIDPIVIAARVVVTLQTIVAREVKPGEVAVVTVGYIQAGTKNNIIPDQAELGAHRPQLQT